MWLTLLTLVAVAIVGIMHIRFVEDISNFFPENGENKRVNDAYQHIGSDNRIVINIKQARRDTTQEVDYELLTTAVDSLVARLYQNDKDSLMQKVFYQVDNQQIADITTFVVKNMPYFLEEEDYARMDTLITSQYTDSLLVNDVMILSSPTGFMQQVILSDPLFFSGNVLKKLDHFRLNDQYQENGGYIFNNSGDEAIVVVTSKFPVSETFNNSRLIQQIDDAMQTVEKQFDRKVKITDFGASLVSQTNSQQIKKDSLWAILLSLSFIVALLIYYYRNLKCILLIVCTISFGGLFALGYIVLFENPISIIAVGVASIIIGIAINYPIHLLSHFKRTSDKEQIIKDIVTPLLIGNITTVGAFLSLLFISSDAMHDLGLFAALLLVGTILFVLIFLPHLLGKRPEKWQEAQLSFRKIAEFHPENHPWLIVVILALTVVFFIGSSKTSFETNMHKINYMTDEQRAAFEKLVAESDTTVQTVYCIAEGKTTDAALQKYEKVAVTLSKMLQDSVTKQVSGISVFLPSQQQQQKRLALWNDFWSKHREQFMTSFAKSAKDNGFSESAFEDFYATLQSDFQPQPVYYFESALHDLVSSYIVEEDGKSMIYSVLQVKKQEREQIEQRLNSVDADVFAFTDSSIITRMIDALSGDFDYVLYICGFIVFAFLLFSFGRLEIALSAFVPLTIAWIWILGIMGIFDIKFNIVNIILATFIFGQGDDYAIFVTEGVMYEYRTGRKMLAQFKNSIILSASIMFLGIGMLIFAKHPAMRSLAEVTVIGMASVVMMAYIFPPLIFKWLTTKNGKLRRVPVTLWNLLKTIAAFSIFFVTSLGISLWAVFCKIFFNRNDRVKQHFHRMLCNVMRFFAKAMFQVDYDLQNPNNEDFKKPSILISNHQSHLDMLYLLTLSPKIVVLTNQWVWNCPFYRWIIRYADFLPVADGIEANVTKLSELVHRGYSILVFPEGTRSANCDILRFHQGAFYLANELNLDVLPVVLHGVGHAFPKEEFLLHKGKVTVSVLNRISANADLRRNQPTLKVAQAFRHLYIREYQRIVNEVETPSYYREWVMQNYIYKGAEVARACRRQFRNFEVWKKEIAKLPDEGTLLIQNCGQGEFSLLVALTKKNLHIFAIEKNQEAFDVASHCAAIPQNLHYVNELDENQCFNLVLDQMKITEK